MKKILVTGSSGTIGTRLCEKLLEAGYDVVGADWKPNKWNAAVQDRTIDIDLRDQEKVFSLLPKDVEMVIHLAANARVWDLVVDPDRARDNIVDTFNMLEYARRNGIRRFAFASSREVYGNLDQPIHKEEDALIQSCESPYTASKIAGEALLWSYQRCYGMDGVIFRFSNVYGMYDESNRFVPLCIQRAIKGEPLQIFGKDKMLDFTYIDDCVDAVIKTVEKFDALKMDVYNVACGQGVTLVKVAEMIKEMTHSKSEITLGDNRTGEVVQYVADIGKAKAKICYEPAVPVEEGIRRSIEWYRRLWNI